MMVAEGGTVADWVTETALSPFNGLPKLIIVTWPRVDPTVMAKVRAIARVDMVSDLYVVSLSARKGEKRKQGGKGRERD